MEQKIETKNGTYFFEPKEFKRGASGKIDRIISKENLLLFRELMIKEGIKFGLMYGTLLGAVREKNFIEYDEDIDLYMLMEFKESFLNTLFKLKDAGFVVKRYSLHEDLISIMKNGQYIDIYFFSKAMLNNRICDGNTIKAKYLEDTVAFQFLGKDFNIPKDTEGALIQLYGKDWRIPKKNAPADNYGPYLYFKTVLRKRSKLLFRIGSYIKKQF